MKNISIGQLAVTISTFALFSLPALATNKIASAKITKQTIETSTKLALYQSNEVVCNDTTYARVETQGYYVNICGDYRGPNRYQGSGKSGQAIILPLQSYSSGKYTAVSGTIRYTLTTNYLTVTKSGRTILKQRVISSN